MWYKEEVMGNKLWKKSEKFEEEKKNLRYERCGLWVGKNVREIRVEKEELKEISS